MKGKREKGKVLWANKAWLGRAVKGKMGRKTRIEKRKESEERKKDLKR